MKRRGILLGALLWTGSISLLHFHLNVDWTTLFNDYVSESLRKLNVAYIPVT
jgi:hypothetical protein